MREHEGLSGLEYLQQDSGLNQVQGTPNSEQMPMIGLSRFYLEMADPPLEFLEAVTRGLINIPFANLRQFQLDTYNAGENPHGFFTRHGVAIEDFEKLRAGIDNAVEIIDDLTHRYDYETGELGWGQELDPKTMAESFYERIQIRNGERKIRKLVEDVRDEPVLERRYRKGLVLKQQVLDYATGFPFTFYRENARDELVEPTWENLQHRGGLFTQLHTKDGSTTSGSFRLGEAVDVAEAAILRYTFERRLKQLPFRDKEEFDQLRLQFGAKAANLIILSKAVKDINELRTDSFDVKIDVPEFQAIPVDVYRAWREGHLIDDRLRPYFDWVSALKDDKGWRSEKSYPADYVVRSSAVFSEDGEHVTGAGIYLSKRVHGGATFDDFKDAVTSVYKSTDSPQAQAYRAQHGIDREDMGLVVQRFASPHRSGMYGQSSEGYINSRLTGVFQLMEIATETSRNFVNRDELDFFIALDAYRNSEAFNTAHHFRPDQYKVDPCLPIRVAQVIYVIERIWGKDVQIEFVGEGNTIHIVQVRELPAQSIQDSPEITFPDETPIHAGASIGFGDMELPVLDENADNTEKSGVVVFRGNYGWSMERNEYHLPKEGAVIIYNSDGQNGHIQTLCAEKGLVFLFPDKDEDRFAAIRYYDLSQLKRVRIVSNGIEARVYRIQDGETSTWEVD